MFELQTPDDTPALHSGESSKSGGVTAETMVAVIADRQPDTVISAQADPETLRALYEAVISG